MKQLVFNRKSHFNYELEQKFEAGIQLLGWEVKAAKAGRISLVDSYVSITGYQAYTVGMSIQPLPYSANAIGPSDATRKRKLLLHKHQIKRIYGHVTEKGMVCVIVSVYLKDHHIKVEIALGRGKKLYDKRQTAKNRDWQRQKDRLNKYSTR